jgi:hypothetical protein
MRETARRARAQVRQLVRADRARNRARRALLTGKPQSMRTHLVGRGLDATLAKNYAGTVSKNVPVAADQVETKRKLKKHSRRTGTFPMFVYTARQVDRALTAYLKKGGPRRASDRAAFAALAH